MRSPSPSSIVKVYTLSDPREPDNIRYVGKTVCKLLRTRLNQHVCTSKSRSNHTQCWISSLLRIGLRPEIRLLEEVSVTDWERTEIYWISQFRCWGFDLTNSTEGGVTPFTTPKVQFKARQKSISALSKPVACYGLSGILLGIYDSAKEAAQKTGCSVHKVRQVTNGFALTTHNLLFRKFVGKASESIPPFIRTYVNQYTKTTT